MSLHSQLLRGLFALPLMLLLAVAGVLAPPSPPAAAQGHPIIARPTALASAIASDDCDGLVVRAQVASR